jgi:hypothetical protein
VIGEAAYKIRFPGLELPACLGKLSALCGELFLAGRAGGGLQFLKSFSRIGSFIFPDPINNKT